MKEFYHKDILNCFPSLHPQTLISFSEKGLIKPLSEPQSRGGKRVYSYSNLIEIAFIHSLMAYGISLKTIKRVVTSKPFQESLIKGEFDKFFIMCTRYLSMIDPKAKKRVQETYWNMEWDILSKSDFKNIKKFDPESSDTMIVINLRRMKEIVDGGLEIQQKKS